MEDRQIALGAAEEHARSWLKSLDTRGVVAQAGIDEVIDRLGAELPDGPTPSEETVELLANAIEPGLGGNPSGRFFGFVMGGTHPAALGADWLVSAWDQNTGLNFVTPGTVGVERLAARWLLDLLRLPADCAVGFVTGGTMANFTCLAAARENVLRRAGWDVDARGLSGGPRVRVLVGAERHDTIDLTLGYLGLGEPEQVEVDDQGRIVPAALEAALADSGESPLIVCLQAGNVHSGAFDPFEECIRLAHEHGAWVHVDGAFGLFAAASPQLRHLTLGYEQADSWGTDAHKTLNVPYDCGIAIVRDAPSLHAAMGSSGAYLITGDEADPHELVPELSRRARGVPVWAVLRSLGRTGVAELVDGFCRHASRFAAGAARIDGAEVLNDVVFTQVCVSFGSDERTRQVVANLLADGTAWMTGSVWKGRAVVRISVCNWSTTDEDVEVSLDALRRAVAAAD